MASEALEWVIAAAGETPVVAHCCAAEPPIALLPRGGRRAECRSTWACSLPAPTTTWPPRSTRATGSCSAWCPSTGEAAPSTTPVVERVRRLLDMLGLDAGEVADQLVLTPACGLAGATPSYARGALRAVREAAAELG